MVTYTEEQITNVVKEELTESYGELSKSDTCYLVLGVLLSAFERIQGKGLSSKYEMKKAQLARCKHCGDVVMASVIPVDEEGAKEFAQLLQDGHPLTVEDVSKNSWDFCDTKCTEEKHTK